jgi:hypothetical protein
MSTKADTIINKVDLGYEISNHTCLESKCGGKTNLFVQPSKGFKVFCDETELSTARIDVVPTVQNTFFLAFAAFTISQAS